MKKPGIIQISEPNQSWPSLVVACYTGRNSRDQASIMNPTRSAIAPPNFERSVITATDDITGIGSNGKAAD